MWMPDMLPPRLSFITLFNPLYQFIELIRAPIMGSFPSFYTILFSFGLILIGFVIAFRLFLKTSHRIAFGCNYIWLLLSSTQSLSIYQYMA